MRYIKEHKTLKIAILLSIPILLIAQFYLFKIGIFRPMVKGVEIEISEGDFIKDIDKYIIKLNDTVELSKGKYIKVPSYAKDPNIWFNVLDNNGTIKIQGNKMTALKVGYSSIGIMKNSRVLKKATIRVVDPKVNSLDMQIDGKLNYVGDSAKIESVVDVDYDKFKVAYTPEFTSSDTDVLKIVGKRVEAIGVGSATITATCGDKEVEKEFDVQALVDSINISKNITIEVDQEYNINPEVETSPEGLEPPKIIYSLAESKLPIERNISLGKNGNIVGLRPGKEKIQISCGNESKTITVNVVKDLISNKGIKNLMYNQTIKGNKIIIGLSWDYMPNVNNYDIFYKNNLTTGKFLRFGSVKVTSKEIGSDGRVYYTMEVDLNKNKKADIDVYIVGNGDGLQTKPSKIVNISNGEETTNEIGNTKVENLSISTDGSDRIYLKWDKVSFKGSTYSVYVRNNDVGENDFTLYKNGIYENEYSFSKPEIDEDGELNIDVYVVATHNGNNSKPSDVANLK
ncbi:Ig-like domain-containing protein [Metaclostridioides mangenotii]|uniref:Ig-like domain (Group 2) n=1 Tax=Metaclostridioides mangenotii TaxID=1540 RepID=A0ABS4E7B1_9FIRM|nr:Ig-like domain-containing protein [Clostridioides mangenotii]MBP1853804.1 hypothetical protein [Clostridioides mangenotii]